MLAYNLGNFLRRLALPRSVQHWSLTTLREKLIKIGAEVVRHSKVRDYSDGRGGGAATLVRGDFGPHPALWSAAAVSAAWLTRRPSDGWRFVGAEVDAARKRAGIAIPEAAGAGLAPWSGQIGVIHSGIRDARFDRVGCSGRMTD